MFKKMAHGFFCIGQGDVGTLLKRQLLQQEVNLLKKQTLSLPTFIYSLHVCPCFNIHAFSPL
jgi:hypothetical protein